MTKQDLEQVGITVDVLKGLNFVFDVADTNDSLCYADEEDLYAKKVAGEWLAKQKGVIS